MKSWLGHFSSNFDYVSWTLWLLPRAHTDPVHDSLSIFFCNFHHIPPFPIAKSTICLFVVALARRDIANCFMKVYLSGIQFHSLLHGHAAKFITMHYFYQVMRGIRRVQGNSLSRPLRNPISNLWSMFGFIEASKFSHHDKMMWRCTIVVAFFGLTARVRIYLSLQIRPSHTSFS